MSSVWDRLSRLRRLGEGFEMMDFCGFPSHGDANGSEDERREKGGKPIR